MKTLVVYCYYESDEQSIKNLRFFLKNGIIEKDIYEYCIVINGKCSLYLKEFSSKNIEYITRENEGYDFGAWGYVLEQKKITEYEKFIFLNSTCIGPFTPRYMKKLDWIEAFISPIDDNTKLCGPTINYKYLGLINPHIQSFAFSTDFIGINILISEGIFNPKPIILKEELIRDHEIRMSTVLLERGFSLYSFQYSEEYSGEKNHDDIHFEYGYYGDTLNPIEIMFIKNNRIKNKTVENYTIFKT
jgi:lipopolysaccharide biosynthesis protein